MAPRRRPRTCIDLGRCGEEAYTEPFRRLDDRPEAITGPQGAPSGILKDELRTHLERVEHDRLHVLEELVRFVAQLDDLGIVLVLAHPLQDRVGQARKRYP